MVLQFGKSVAGDIPAATIRNSQASGHGENEMYYFAYASNLCRKQMSEHCPDSQPKFVATLLNHKRVFTGWSRKWYGGTASIKPLQGEKVLGAVYEISRKTLK